MNRRGSSVLGKEIPFWVIFMFILPFLFLIGGFAAGAYKDKLVSVPVEVTSELVALRFVQTADCFAYHDVETGRVVSGVIDLTKFNAEQMKRCYDARSGGGIRAFNFRLTLRVAEQEVLTSDYFYHDKDALTLFRDVIVFDGESFYKDELTIYVQEKIRS